MGWRAIGGPDLLIKLVIRDHAKAQEMLQELKNIASRLNFFPSMRGAAVNLLALVDDPEINVAAIERSGMTSHQLEKVASQTIH